MSDLFSAYIPVGRLAFRQIYSELRIAVSGRECASVTPERLESCGASGLWIGGGCICILDQVCCPSRLPLLSWGKAEIKRRRVKG